MDDITKEYYLRTQMTHVKQIEMFGWCMCEDGKGHIGEGCNE